MFEKNKKVNRKIDSFCVYVYVFQEFRERELKSFSELQQLQLPTPCPQESLSFKMLFANHHLFVIKNPHRIVVVWRVAYQNKLEKVQAMNTHVRK